MSSTLITITGNLGDNPEIRTTSTGKATARLRVAVTRRRRDTAGTWTEQTDWHTVVAWGTLAEAAADLRKGQGLIVAGRLAQRDWTTSTGEKKTVWEITADHIGMTLRPRRLSETRPASRDRDGDRGDYRNQDQDQDRDRGRGAYEDWDREQARVRGDVHGRKQVRGREQGLPWKTDAA